MEQQLEPARGAAAAPGRGGAGADDAVLDRTTLSALVNGDSRHRVEDAQRAIDSGVRDRHQAIGWFRNTESGVAGARLFGLFGFCPTWRTLPEFGRTAQVWLSRRTAAKREALQRSFRQLTSWPVEFVDGRQTR